MILKLLAAAVVVVAASLGFIARSAPTSTSTPPSTAPTALPAAAPGDQTVVITEAMLDDVLTQQFVGRTLASTPMGPATLQHVQTHLANGQIQANGDAAVGASTVPISMTGRVDVQNGRPVVTVQDARAAGMPVPDSTRSSVQQAMQSELDRQVQLAHLSVKSMTVRDGTLVIVGTPQS